MNPGHYPLGPALTRVCLVLFLTLLAGGCAATHAPGTAPAASLTAPTPDGGSEPEVIIRATDPERVRQEAIALVSRYGGRLVRARPDQLLFSREGKVAAGSGADPSVAPVFFVRLTLVPAGPGRVRVSASGMITGPRPAGLSDARARTLLLAGLQRLQTAVESGS